MSKFLVTVVILWICLGGANVFAEGYILSYFGGSEKKEAMCLAYSTDGLHWKALNDNKPVLKATIGNKSIRDPYIFRKQDGDFVVMSTNSWKSEYIIIWDSKDLISFTNERLVRMNTGGQHAWAPECIYDAVKKNYVIYWSGDVIYANTTTDFINFSTSVEFFNPGYICIDADITAHRGNYYLVFKDERGRSADTTKFKALKVAKSGSLEPGSFRVFTPEYITDHLVEGPAVIKDPKKEKWYLFYDYFTKGGIWGCSSTMDLESGKWTKMDPSEFSLPAGVRHGNAVKVSNRELKKILARWK
jgi:hypothetical protein